MALNLSTEGISRASARRPKTVLALWGVLLLAALAINALLLGDVLTTEQDFTNAPESKTGMNLLEERLRGPQKISEIAIVRSETLTADDPLFRQRVIEVTEAATALGPGVVDFQNGFANIVSYVTPDLPEEVTQALVSRDRHTALVRITMAGDVDDAASNVDALVKSLLGPHGEAVSRDGIEVMLTGPATIGRDFNHLAESDLIKGESIGVLVALVVLVAVFGTLVAAPVPIILAAVGIVTAMAFTALVGQFFKFSFFVTNMITMIGLAVGIDYSLLIVARVREERRRGLEKLEAIARAGSTASRAVFFSGTTVVLALLGMLIVPTTIFRSLALGAIFVVIFSVIATMTLLPAVLSMLGDRINRLAVPFFARNRLETPGQARQTFWDRSTNVVMDHPILSLTLAVALMVAFTLPFFNIKLGLSGVETLPDRFESKQAFEVLNREFSGGLVSPTEIVIDGDVGSSQVQAAVQRLREALRADPAFGGSTYEQNAAGNLAVVTTQVPGDSASDEAQSAVRRLRSDIVPQAFTGVPVATYVSGVTALNIDFLDLTDVYTPWVFVLVLSLSFVLLTIVFRSIVIPVKAIMMNLLSVGAAYGLLVLFTQQGFLKNITGFQQVEVIEAWLPLFLFSVLFGLSMDYHVFLLSRIRETYDQTHDNRFSVAFGLRRTAGIITGAALIMVAVFGGFASGELVMFQQLGFGLGVSVFLDATVIRSVVVPASMRLLGDWNWYLPGFLKWLPDLRVEGEPEPQHHAPSPAGGSQ